MCGRECAEQEDEEEEAEEQHDICGDCFVGSPPHCNLKALARGRQRGRGAYGMPWRVILDEMGRQCRRLVRFMALAGGNIMGMGIHMMDRNKRLALHAARLRRPLPLSRKQHREYQQPPRLRRSVKRGALQLSEYCDVVAFLRLPGKEIAFATQNANAATAPLLLRDSDWQLLGIV